MLRLGWGVFSMEKEIIYWYNIIGSLYEKEVRIIKILFWNIYNKNLISPLIDMIKENQLDIVSLAEAENLDITAILNHLKLSGNEWNDIQISPQNDIRVLAKKEIKIIPYKEDGHYSIYKIKKYDKVDCLLVVVHLLSKKTKSNEAQYNSANDIARELNKYEQEFFENNEKRTIIVGDFNMQPYEAGICSGYGFNATMSASITNIK